MKGVGDGGPFFFRRGLESRIRRADAPRLPEARGLPPAATETITETDLVFPLSDLDAALERDTQPDLADRSLLEPAAFEEALEEATDVLADLGRDPAARGAAGPAAALLDDLLADRGLLERARRALLRA